MEEHLLCTQKIGVRYPVPPPKRRNMPKNISGNQSKIAPSGWYWEKPLSTPRPAPKPEGKKKKGRPPKEEQ
jgi:hypothetical protein